MASLFKPKFRRWRDADGRPCKKTTPGATFTEYEAEKWYGSFVDQDGIKRKVPLSIDKSAAEILLGEKRREVERRRLGIIDNFTDNELLPIKAHLAAYQAYLESKGTDPDHVADTLRYCRMICDHRLPQQRTANGNKRRKSKVTTAEKHKPIEKLSHITADRIVAYLNDLIRLGRSARTYNAYLQAIQQFCAWCVIHGRRGDNPIRHLEKRNVDKDRRYERRTLSDVEIARLIAAAAASGETFRRLSGPGPGHALQSRVCDRAALW